MTARLQMLCHAATPATRAGAFPADEPVEARERARIAALPVGLARHARVLAAPSLAARQTAESLASEVAEEPALRDLDAGAWRGRALADLAASDPAALGAWMADPHAAPHGGESIASLIGRVGAWLDGGGFDGRILAVTHAAVVRAAVVHVLGAPARAFWAVDVAPLSIAVLSHDGRRWTLRLPLPAAPEA